MYGVRSIQPPDEQKAPVLSVLNESVTSGALPPRSAATILSSLTLPTLSTETFGFCFSNLSMIELKTSSSRPVKPLQIVRSYCLSGSKVCASPELELVELSSPPQAASPSAAATAAEISRVTIAVRLIVLSLARFVKFWLGTLSMRP